jgi:zinc protease
MVLAIANQGVEPTTLKDQLDAAVARILAEGVTEEEIEKAKNAYRSSDIFGRQTTMQIAENIHHYAHYHDSLDEIHTDLDAYMAVTADDVQRVAQKYLAPENSFTINDLPPSASQPAVP